MGNALTTMFSEGLNGTRCIMLSGVAFKALIGTSVSTNSLLKWFTGSRSTWTRIPSIFNGLSFTVPPFLRILDRTWKKSASDIVMTPAMERRYWRRSAKDRVALQRSDARFVGEKTGRSTRVPADLPPLVLYYTPALPPLKHKRETRKSGDLFYLSAKNYCKWHWMVFPGKVRTTQHPNSLVNILTLITFLHSAYLKKHPTIAEAARLRNNHDSEELEEMYRISRMLPDDEVFPSSGVQRRPLSSKYQKKWKRWLASRPGGEIVFEDTSSDDLTMASNKSREERTPKKIATLKLTAFGPLRAKNLDGGYDVKAMLPILINALH